MRKICLAGCSFVALTASAWAADYYPPTPETAPWLFSGYLDVHGGFSPWSESGTFDSGSATFDDHSNATIFGGAARAALAVAPSVSVQLDAWANSWSVNGHYEEVDGGFFEEDYSFSTSLYGFGGHLSYVTPEGTLVGVLASIGNSWAGYGGFANVGVEAVHNTMNWRLYGQAGYSFATGGDALLEAAQNPYVIAAATYYVTPDFSIGGNAGFDWWSDNSDGGTSGSTFSWGARIEHKLASLPISGYIAYQGWCWNGSDGDAAWKGTSYSVVAGVRLAFGQDTLRGLDQAVGLVDANPVYGDLIH